MILVVAAGLIDRFMQIHPAELSEVKIHTYTIDKTGSVTFV